MDKYFNWQTRYGTGVDIVLSTINTNSLVHYCEPCTAISPHIQYKQNDRRKSLWRKQPYPQTDKLDPLHSARTPKKTRKETARRRGLIRRAFASITIDIHSFQSHIDIPSSRLDKNSTWNICPLRYHSINHCVLLRRAVYRYTQNRHEKNLQKEASFLQVFKYIDSLNEMLVGLYRVNDL